MLSARVLSLLLALNVVVVVSASPVSDQWASCKAIDVRTLQDLCRAYIHEGTSTIQGSPTISTSTSIALQTSTLTKTALTTKPTTITTTSTQPSTIVTTNIKTMPTTQQVVVDITKTATVTETATVTVTTTTTAATSTSFVNTINGNPTPSIYKRKRAIDIYTCFNQAVQLDPIYVFNQCHTFPMYQPPRPTATLTPTVVTVALKTSQVLTTRPTTLTALSTTRKVVLVPSYTTRTVLSTNVPTVTSTATNTLTRTVTVQTTVFTSTTSTYVPIATATKTWNLAYSVTAGCGTNVYNDVYQFDYGGQTAEEVQQICLNACNTSFDCIAVSQQCSSQEPCQCWLSSNQKLSNPTSDLQCNLPPQYYGPLNAYNLVS